jgi:hypothetical protein
MGDTGEVVSAWRARLESLVKPDEVVSARPLELLPLCSGIVCRTSLFETMSAPGYMAAGNDGLVGSGGSGGDSGIGFRLIRASTGIEGVEIRCPAGL